MQEHFERLLQFENDSNIMDYRFQYKNLLIWPYVRYFFIEEACRQLFEEQKENQSSLEDAKQTQGQRRGMFERLKDAFLSRPKKTKKDIIFLCHNGSNVVRPDGKVYNRIFDEYAMVYPEKTLMLETPVEGYRSDNRVVSHVISSKYMELVILVRVKFTKQNKGDITEINRFLCYMKDNFPVKLSDSFYEHTQCLLLEQARKIKHVDIYFHKLIKSISPKLVFVEDGCYGLDKAQKIKILHDMNIPVREIQHGLVTLSHVAYNYPDRVRESKEYLSYMPDVFYTFGEYWSKNIRLPIPTKVLGNANYSSSVEGQDYQKQEKEKCIFIALTDHADPFVNLVRHLLSQLDAEYSIIVKTHPKDAALKEKFVEFEKYENFLVTGQGNIFDYIAEAEYVVSDYSTTLYEAEGCGKKVFVYKCMQAEWFISKDIGVWFETPEEFLKRLYEDYSKIHKIQEADYYFNGNWKENYKGIIGEL